MKTLAQKAADAAFPWWAFWLDSRERSRLACLFAEEPDGVQWGNSPFAIGDASRCITGTHPSLAHFDDVRLRPFQVRRLAKWLKQRQRDGKDPAEHEFAETHGFALVDFLDCCPINAQFRPHM